MQGFQRQRRTPVRAADAQVHHLREALPAGADAPPAAHRFGQIRDLPVHGGDAGLDVLAVHQDRLGRHIAQGRVQGRAALAVVDRLTGKQRRAPARQFGRLGQRQQRGKGGIVQQMLGQIHVQAGHVQRVARSPLRIGGEQAGHPAAGQAGLCGGDGLPGG